MDELMGLNALNIALNELMEADPKVVCLGEDIGPAGGCWTYFGGLQQRFGKDRVMQTPICELGYTGVANGLAYGGYRPVVEYMYADFGGQSGCQHSQSVEAWFANVPGLKLGAPTTPADMRYFFKAAVLDDDPVCFFFSRTCSMSITEPIDTDDKTVPALTNAAKIVKEGADLTVVAWHRSLLFAQKAAEEVEKETGKTIEIINPRVLIPFDSEKVYASVRKTGKALICHEAPERGGFGTLISAWIAENCLKDLKAPVARCGGANTCVPFGAVEEFAFPQVEDMKAAMRKLL